MLRFERLDDGQMREILAEASPGLDEMELTALIKAGEGAAGKALQYIDVNLAELEDIAKKIMATGDLDNGLKNDLARKLSLKAATKRYRTFVERAPTMIAGQIKAMAGSDKFQAIEIWQQANNLAAVAIPKALDSHAVVFRLAAMMGSLAQTDRRA
jgi:DNA polymerase-3 subunit delta'